VRHLPRFTIKSFAVVCVAVIGAYVMWLGYRVNETLAGPTWCATAIGANRADKDSKIDVAGSCVNLLTIQLRSLATNSHILLGTVALCLVVLIVIVVAGARLSGDIPGGGHVDMSADPNAPRETVKAAAEGAAAGAVGAAQAPEPKP
jgi:hypothetical protein